MINTLKNNKSKAIGIVPQQIPVFCHFLRNKYKMKCKSITRLLHSQCLVPNQVKLPVCYYFHKREQGFL